MAVIGEEIKDYVKNQINARQTLHGSGVGYTDTSRTGKQINLLNSNTSWIKLASGVSVDEARLKDIGLDPSLSDTILAENFVLFSGVSRIRKNIVEGINETTQEITEEFSTQLEQREGFLPRDGNSSYTYGSFGFSPMPGIISADIKTLTRGSLKKATVKLTANNKEQFNIIDILYMRLGYTVLLEWGNSIYTTNGEDKEILRNTLIEEKFFKSYGSDSYFTFLNDIEAKRDKHAGNYDALLGKVSNFNWSFNSDGSYNIELTIISLGDVIESLKSNLSVDSETNKFLNQVKSFEKITKDINKDIEESDPKPTIEDYETDSQFTYYYTYNQERGDFDRVVGGGNYDFARNAKYSAESAFYSDLEAWETRQNLKKKEEVVEEEEGEEEEIIDDENSTADIITALLTIFKLKSQDLNAKTIAVDHTPGNGQTVQLITTNSEGIQDIKTIGSLLDPKIEEEFGAGVVKYEFIYRYLTKFDVSSNYLLPTDKSKFGLDN
jgi:hypothetical protein